MRARMMNVRIIALCLLLALAAAGGFTATQAQNQLLIDGKPTALTFARNFTDPAAIKAYHALGFNTLLLQVDSPGELAMLHYQDLLDAADAEGLYVLIELENGDWTMNRRENSADPKYVEAVNYFLDGIIPRLHTGKRLVGWIIGTVEEDQLVSTDVGSFSVFLQAKYGTIAKLNAAWSYVKEDEGRTYHANVPSFRVITEQNVAAWTNAKVEMQQKAAADVKEYREAVAGRDADFQRFLKSYYQNIAQVNGRWSFEFENWEAIRINTILAREKTRPGSSPMSLLDLAAYQAAAPRQLMDWWVQQISARDKTHLFFAGHQHSYRTLITLPPSVNGAYVECYPGVAEADVESHNPHAIDIARRGNRFIVLAGIQAYNANPQRFAQYLYAPAIHGAAGIGINDWAQISASANQSMGYAEILQRALADLQDRELFNRVPTPRTAIVYSPYALGPANWKRPLFGYLSGYPTPGPGLLYYFLRNGTCYGQVDYLAAEDLTVVPLERYSTIILASTLDLPVPSQQAIAKFVEDGGVAVADIGVGTVQANGDFYALPPGLRTLFGVQNVTPYRQVRYNLEVYRTHPRFPSLLQGMRTTGVPEGYMISCSSKATPLPGTDLLFQSVSDIEHVAPKLPDHARAYVPLLGIKPVPQGLFIVRHGRGFALYAPFPLYQHWLPGNMLFGEFHRELLGGGWGVCLQTPIDFLPAFTELAQYADGSIALWGKDSTPPVAQVRNSARQVYAMDGGSCEIGPTITLLRCTTPGLHLAHALPVTLEPSPVTLVAQVQQNDEQQFALELRITDDQDQGTLPTLHIASGRYGILPNSRHVVTLVMPSGAHSTTLQADGSGRLTITPGVPHCGIIITGTESGVEIEKPTPPPALDEDIIIDMRPGGASEK